MEWKVFVQTTTGEKGKIVLGGPPVVYEIQNHGPSRAKITIGAVGEPPVIWIDPGSAVEVHKGGGEDLVVEISDGALPVTLLYRRIVSG